MSNVDASRLAIISVRALMLGAIVYGAITIIPTQPLVQSSKVIIAAVVVVIYALLDYLAGFFVSVRTFFCRATCGCTPNNGLGPETDTFDRSGKYVSNALDTDSLSTEVEEALKLLDTKVNQAEPPGLVQVRVRELPIESEEEQSAKKATGLERCESEPSAPVPAEIKEGYVNYSSW